MPALGEEPTGMLFCQSRVGSGSGTLHVRTQLRASVAQRSETPVSRSARRRLRSASIVSADSVAATSA